MRQYPQPALPLVAAAIVTKDYREGHSEAAPVQEKDTGSPQKEG